MGNSIVGLVVLVMVVGTAGTAFAIGVETFPQQIAQSDHDVTSGKKFSVDSRTTVFSGADVAGYDVTVRNDGSSKLTVNVTVTLETVDGTVVATASDEDVVLTGSTNTFAIRFDSAVPRSNADRVVVEAAAS